MADPPGVYFGSGNANSNFTVDTNNGIELGLSAITRYVGPIVPSPTSSDIYYAPTGATTQLPHTGSAWGFDFSVNLRPPGGSSLTLSDVTVTLTLVDVANATSGSANPLLIPDNTCWDGIEDGPPCSSSTDYGAQNSETLSFASIAAALGDPSYNEYANDTYFFTLQVSDVDGVLATDQIEVIAGTGAVPEPTTLALFGTALLGLGMICRRRTAA